MEEVEDRDGAPEPLHPKDRERAAEAHEAAQTQHRAEVRKIEHREVAPQPGKTIYLRWLRDVFKLYLLMLLSLRIHPPFCLLRVKFDLIL